jgi:hypothetical protein
VLSLTPPAGRVGARHVKNACFVSAKEPRTPVDLSYEVTFRFTGVIDKLTYKLGPRQWSEMDRKAVEEMVARAHD